MKLAGKYRVLNTNVSGLQSVMEEGDYQQMLENGYIDIDDMRNKTKSGLGRFSADVTDKALVDDIIDFMKNAGDDKALYLDLGHEIDINGEKARYMPIHRIDPSDVFELEGKLRVNEHLTDYTQKYYTGSAYHSNIILIVACYRHFLFIPSFNQIYRLILRLVFIFNSINLHYDWHLCQLTSQHTNAC